MTPDARLWHPWLRINRVLRVMLHTRWSAEAWPPVKAEFKKALTLRSKIQRAGRGVLMHAINKQLVFGLLLVLTAGCGVKTECEITCADGFKTTETDECEDEVTVALAKQHGGSCVGEEHNQLCFPWCE